MTETSAIIRFIHKDKNKLGRIRYYLDAKTRPSFDDEVPKEEISVFEAMEFSEVPVLISSPDNKTLNVYYESAKESDLKEVIKTLSYFKPETVYLFFQDDEEYKIYWQFIDEKFIELYSNEDDRKIKGAKG